MGRSVLVRVLRHGAGPVSALNTPTETWAEVGKVYAAIVAHQDAQGDAADQEMGVSQATFRVRDNVLTRAITTKDRMRVRGVVWRVSGNSAVTSSRGYRDIVAVMRSDGDGA